MKKEFKAIDDSLKDVLAFVDDILSDNDVSMKIIFKVDVVVEEIFVNIAHYSQSDIAIVEADVNDGVLSLTFKDRGIPFDPLAKDDPDIHTALEDRDIGGLGIFMVKKMMDSVEYCYENEWNILTLKKNCK